IFSSHVKNIIGTGVVVDPLAFKAEIEELAHIMPDQDLFNRILISQKAHLVLPTH
ncbi:MAG TPA: adenylosuccinate synthase, partial [Sphingobacterium sp.]|nr:adenylosuccinate synthase [Sphingobacterium sp.]